jgi:hypothetical protein
MEALAGDSFFFRLLSGVFSKISSPRPENVFVWYHFRNDRTRRFSVSRFVGMGEISQ